MTERLPTIYVVNYKGKQVQSVQTLVKVTGDHLVFDDGYFCSVDDEIDYASPSFSFIDPSDERFVTESVTTTETLVIIDVIENEDGTIVVLGRNSPFPVILGIGSPFGGVPVGLERVFERS